MSTAGPDQTAAAVLPAALELTTAYTAAHEDPAFFWETMRRVVGESLTDATPDRAVAELLFGLAALSGILVTELAARSGQDRGEVITELHRRYVAG